MGDYYINVFLDDEKLKKIKEPAWPIRLRR